MSPGSDEKILNLQGDQLTDRFLRILTELAITHCLSSETAPAPGRGVMYNFAAIDAYVRLLTTLINAHGGGPLLLAKALTILCTGERGAWPYACR